MKIQFLLHGFGLMVMLGVVPGKVATEVFSGLGIIEKAAGVLRGAFDGAEG